MEPSSDSDDRKSVSPTLQAPPQGESMSGESFWMGKCESKIKAELSQYGFRCILEKDHMGRHLGAWCAPFIDERGNRMLTVEVRW